MPMFLSTICRGVWSSVHKMSLLWLLAAGQTTTGQTTTTNGRPNNNRRTMTWRCQWSSKLDSSTRSSSGGGASRMQLSARFAHGWIRRCMELSLHIHPPTSIHPPINRSAHPIDPPTSPTYPSIYPFIQPSIHSSMHSSIHPSILGRYILGR